MVPYQHQPLDNGSIRLFQLLPDPDPDNPAKPIRSRLRHHALLNSSSTHAFEALSYAWVSDEKPHSISIDDHQYAITSSLYAALLHLRDRFVERYIWIDAICIDQANNAEKGHQVQHMARIYSQATRVIVWLGGATGDGASDRALDSIRQMAKGKGKKQNVNSEEVTRLLQRPWFERIWVLQEVAAARQVLIKCGHAELDGYAFSLGVETLEPLYDGDQNLHISVSSACYLIKNSIYRPRQHIGQKALSVSEASGPPRYSLNIRPLRELFDIFRARKATNHLDTVYALLGMCSDDPSKVGLSPDYDAQWQDVFRKLLLCSIPSQGLSLEFLDGRERKAAVIASKGCVLGTVKRIERGGWVELSEPRSRAARPPKRLKLHASVANAIRPGDIICLLQGASRSMVIRLHADYATIISMTTPFGDDDDDPTYRNASSYYDEPYYFGKTNDEVFLTSFMDTLDERLWLQYSAPISRFPDKFLLLLDWGHWPPQAPPSPLDAGAETDQENKKDGQGPEGGDQGQHRQHNHYNEPYQFFDDAVNFAPPAATPTTPPNGTLEVGVNYDRLMRIWDAGQILESAENFEKSEMHVLEPVRMFEQILKNRERNQDCTHLQFIFKCLGTASQIVGKGSPGEILALYSAIRHGCPGIVRHMLEDRGNTDDLRSKRGGNTPLEVAIRHNQVDIVRLLVEFGADVNNCDNYGTPALQLAIPQGATEIVRILLEGGADIISECFPSSSTALLYASTHGTLSIIREILHFGPLVEERDANDRAPLHLLSYNEKISGQEAAAAAQLLIDHGADLNQMDESGSTPLITAVLSGPVELVRFLLDKGAHEDLEYRDPSRDPLWIAASIRDDKQILQLLEDYDAYQ